MTEQLLPQSMADFSDAIGASATLSLIRVFGGGRVYVPQADGLDDTHPLIRLLGRPLAEKLASRMGGESYEIPTARAVDIDLRNEEIRRRFLNGDSIRGIAKSIGVSKTVVWGAIRADG